MTWDEFYAVVRRAYAESWNDCLYTCCDSILKWKYLYSSPIECFDERPYVIPDFASALGMTIEDFKRMIETP
jgi:hypothetical protein